MIELKSNYREVMAYQIYSVIGFLVAPFSVWALVRGQLLLGIPPLATAILCIINVFYFRKFNRFYIKPTLISFFYILNIVIIVHELGAVGAYWAFPTLLALYWVHERRLAIQMVIIFFVGTCASAFVTVPLETTVRIGATLLTTAVFFNIAAAILEQQYAELKKLTVTDHLTGAYNRRFMDNRIDQLIERRKRVFSKAALIAIDIDHFKKINDEFGHSVGDTVLIDIVELIKSRVRVLDSVCRAGGEEFIVILPDTSENQAKALGEELRLFICSSPLLKNSQVTVSCGVSGLLASDNRDSWLRRCDQALYAAKRNGRNTVAVLPPPPHKTDVLAEA